MGWKVKEINALKTSSSVGRGSCSGDGWDMVSQAQHWGQLPERAVGKWGNGGPGALCGQDGCGCG